MTDRRAVESIPDAHKHSKLLIELLHQEPITHLNPVINWKILKDANPILYHELQLIKLKSKTNKE